MIPPFLKPGDTIGICATARWLTVEQQQRAEQVLTSWGFRVRWADQVTTREFQLAGSDVVRRAALQSMLDDASVRAILLARGGYGTVRVVDGVDWSGFRTAPKWICGYSDGTVLLNALTNEGNACIHSTMPVSFPDCTPEALEQLRRALTGEWKDTRWSGPALREGECEGMVVGGNLSVIMSQLGSSTQLRSNGSILFLEDVDEMVYHVDRMMMALRRSGLLSGIRGAIVGGLTQMRDNTVAHGFPVDNPWGRTAEEVLAEHLLPLGVPVAFGFPAGHLSDNRAFPMGVPMTLSVRTGDCSLEIR